MDSRRLKGIRLILMVFLLLFISLINLAVLVILIIKLTTTPNNLTIQNYKVLNDNVNVLWELYEIKELQTKSISSFKDENLYIQAENYDVCKLHANLNIPSISTEEKLIKNLVENNDLRTNHLQTQNIKNENETMRISSNGTINFSSLRKTSIKIDNINTEESTREIYIQTKNQRNNDAISFDSNNIYFKFKNKKVSSIKETKQIGKMLCICRNTGRIYALVMTDNHVTQNVTCAYIESLGRVCPS